MTPQKSDREDRPAPPPVTDTAPPADPFRETIVISRGENVNGLADQTAAAHKGPHHPEA